MYMSACGLGRHVHSLSILIFDGIARSVFTFSPARLEVEEIRDKTSLCNKEGFARSLHPIVSRHYSLGAQHDMGAAGELDVFDAGRCADGYALGLAVGRRFADAIGSRMRRDLVLREQLLPFASTAEARPLLAALQAANSERYPRYWDELVGTADGSGVPLLHVRRNDAALAIFAAACWCFGGVDCLCSILAILRNTTGHPGQLQEGDPAVRPEGRR
jgi:hypothetical protein